MTCARGHEVFPVTLTGLGERVHLASEAVDLETHIADVVGVLDFEDLHDAVLVGHSYAGIVVTGVADRRPERLSGVVYLDCSPVPDGVALVDALTPEGREHQERDVRERGDGWRWPVPDRETLATGMFGDTSDLTDEHFALIASRGTPQPYGTFRQPLRLSGDGSADLARSVVVCTRGGLTSAAIREMVESGDPRGAALTGPGWRFVDLDAGHWAMFSAPGLVAETLHALA